MFDVSKRLESRSHNLMIDVIIDREIYDTYKLLVMSEIKMNYSFISIFIVTFLGMYSLIIE